MKSNAAVTIVVPISKVDAKKQIVLGVVLEPGIVDAHQDWERAATIERAAHKFLSRFGRPSEEDGTKLGVQHKIFGVAMELVESYIAPVDFMLGEDEVKAGSWIMGVHVLDEDVWQAVEDGGITGFSIAGDALVLGE